MRLRLSSAYDVATKESLYPCEEIRPFKAEYLSSDWKNWDNRSDSGGERRKVSPGHLNRPRNRAKQINKSILPALSFSTVSVVESADQEGQIVWESGDQCGTQLLFGSPLSHTGFASISCWSNPTCQWKFAVYACLNKYLVMYFCFSDKSPVNPSIQTIFVCLDTAVCVTQVYELGV